MKSQVNGFNRVALIYDFLARLVFGNSIKHSQEYFLNHIADRKNVLILGGGTGWILESLERINFKGEVSYVEASSAMIDRARLRNIRAYPIHFLHGTEQDIPKGNIYDAVITNFYLDLFPEDKLSLVIPFLTEHLRAGSVLVATDFTNSRSVWHRFLLHVMYVFFRATAGVRNKSLPGWENLLKRNQFVTVDEKKFYGGFIKSLVMTYQSRNP